MVFEGFQRRFRDFQGVSELQECFWGFQERSGGFRGRSKGIRDVSGGFRDVTGMFHWNKRPFLRIAVAFRMFQGFSRGIPGGLKGAPWDCKVVQGVPGVLQCVSGALPRVSRAFQGL